jgi:S1-C subfamily serine protease
MPQPRNTLKRAEGRSLFAPRSGDLRTRGASLGTIPDYAGPPKGESGMLLAGVRPGGAAEKAGLRRGDRLVQLGPHRITGVRDLMYALADLEPGQTVKAGVVRDGKTMELTVTLGASGRR